MSCLKIKGGELNWPVKARVSGNKNSALACLAASLVLKPDSPNNFILKNVPDISDVSVFRRLLENFRVSVTNIQENTLSVKRQLYSGGDEIVIPPDDAKRLRASVLLIGPLLRNYSKVLVPQLGGDKIGPRPIDVHIKAFNELGFKISFNKDFLVFEKDLTSKLSRNLILKEASVTATENVLLFLAGNSSRLVDLIIYNAACEPHVQTLCRLLQFMGATILGVGSNVLVSRHKELNVNETKPVEISIEPDYIEALTFAVAAAVTKSRIEIRGVNPEHLLLMDFYMQKMGVQTYLSRPDFEDPVWVVFGERSKLKIDPVLQEIKAEPWYGLPSDALPLLAVLATQCEGEIELVDYMYNGRLLNLASALINMGARIRVIGNRSLLISGFTRLSGKTELIPDIRNGVGLVLAALCARGESIIENFEIIERGYEKLAEKLIGLGAKVEKI